jgi:predicted CoA-binding protein
VLSISLKEENQPLAIMASDADLNLVSVLMVGCSSLPKAGRPFRPKGSAVRVFGVHSLVDPSTPRQSPDRVIEQTTRQRDLHPEEDDRERRTATVHTVPDTDDIVEKILTTYDTITVVGASTAPAKAAHSVPLHMQRHGWRIIPVNPHAMTILDEPVFRRLAGVPEQIGLVDVFRPSVEAAEVARQAVDGGATALWLQLGITSDEARSIAEGAGLLYVEDRCLIIEQRRLGLEAPDIH